MILISARRSEAFIFTIGASWGAFCRFGLVAGDVLIGCVAVTLATGVCEVGASSVNSVLSRGFVVPLASFSSGTTALSLSVFPPSFTIITGYCVIWSTGAESISVFVVCANLLFNDI